MSTARENEAGGLRLRVDETRCLGVGQCELLAPDVIVVDDDTGLARPLDDGLIGADVAAQLIDRCPSAAISAEPG